MVPPTAHTMSGSLDQVQTRTTYDRGARQSPSSNGSESGWFLPGSDASLRTIGTDIDSDLEGASPDAIANRVLAHIGA